MLKEEVVGKRAGGGAKEVERIWKEMGDRIRGKKKINQQTLLPTSRLTNLPT